MFSIDIILYTNISHLQNNRPNTNMTVGICDGINVLFPLVKRVQME